MECHSLICLCLCTSVKTYARACARNKVYVRHQGINHETETVQLASEHHQPYSPLGTRHTPPHTHGDTVAACKAEAELLYQ